MIAGWSSLMLLKPCRRLSSFDSSSQTSLLRLCFVMPFCCANFSHFVGSLGLGTGFARGKAVVGGGS